MKFWVYKDNQLLGVCVCSLDQAVLIRSRGYVLVPDRG